MEKLSQHRKKKGGAQVAEIIILILAFGMVVFAYFSGYTLGVLGAMQEVRLIIDKRLSQLAEESKIEEKDGQTN